MLLEKTQRRLCRVLFFLGCVLPTIGVAGFATQRLLPGFAPALLADASDRLGLEVTCERIETPRPGVYELSGVLLGDAIACDRVRLERDGEWRLVAGRVSLRDRGAARRLGERLIESGVTARARFERVELLTGGRATLFEEARLTLHEGRLTIADRAGLTLTADAQTLRIDTNGRFAPLAWLPETPLSACLPGGGFAGVVDAEWSESEPVAGEANGRFDAPGLRLSQASAQQATLTDARLRWRGERLESLTGELLMSGGRLSQALVYGLVTRIEMGALDRLLARWEAQPRPEWFDFTRFACRVALDERGLRVTATEPVVAYEGEALLAAPANPLPAERLVQAWYPDDPVELPARRAAVEMANRLPGGATR